MTMCWDERWIKFISTARISSTLNCPPPVVRQLGLSSGFAHLDSTGFHVDGRYNSNTPPEEEGVIHITQGYSRDHRPDLNQVVLQLICERQAGIP